MSESIYLQLRELMDKLPGGYPATESGIELKLLRKMYTEEEAAVATQLSGMPATAAEVATRMGRDVAEIAPILERMNRKVSVMTRVVDGEPRYVLWHFLIGTWEGQMIHADGEFVSMAREYMPHLAKVFASIDTQQTRVIPVETSVSANAEVKPYDEIHRLIDKHDKFVVAPCVCSKQGEFDDDPCEHTMDRCISMGSAAEHYLHHDFGREVTRDEIHELLELGESEGLVLNVSNSEDSNFVCLCCGCHCVLLNMLKLGGRKPGEQVRSSFRAAIDQDECTACELCVEQCQMDAIEVDDDDEYAVDGDRCIGCGICVATCAYEAVNLIAKADPKPVFDNPGTLYGQMLVERGVLPKPPA